MKSNYLRYPNESKYEKIWFQALIKATGNKDVSNYILVGENEMHKTAIFFNKKNRDERMCINRDGELVKNIY